MSSFSQNMGGSPLLDGLTEPQLEAVTHVDGPLLVLAGAGSGKTRVITRRVAYLVLEVGIAPWNVLAITFTNKAAGEMRQRAEQLLSGKQAGAANIFTFHSLCSRILRNHADRLGLTSGYSIYDTADQKRAVKLAVEQCDISSSNFPPAKVLDAISGAKNELLGPEDYANYAHDYFSKNVLKIYRQYQVILKKNNALDFDDLLMKTVQLLRSDAQVLKDLQERYQYILIDEYQDTNHAQFMIANALAGSNQNICATGDPDQSIYGWRGANIQNILDFERHYPEAKTVRLEQNYRSTKNILAVADGLIAHNTQRKHKELWTDNEQGDPVRVVTCHDERHEAKLVVEAFTKAHDHDQVSWSGMAVFYRTNSLSRVVEDELRNSGIPYQVARGTAFYDRKEIKDAVAYLRVIANPADEVNLTRIINTPARGISQKSVKAMQAHAVANSLTLADVLHNPGDVPSLNTRAVNSVNKFNAMLNGWQKLAGLDPTDFADPNVAGDDEPTLRGFVERILRESGLEDMCRNDKSDPDMDRLANLGELVTSAQQFEDDLMIEIDAEDQSEIPLPLATKLESLLEQISLVSDVDAVDPEIGSVTLMTLHAAKGLEFPIVAMVGVEDGLLPHERSQDDATQLEEERRLCFVGVTRAMRRLQISHARYRTIFGQMNPTIPSRFIKEMPAELLEKEDRSGEEDVLGGGGKRAHLAGPSYDAAIEAAEEFEVGTLVRHPQFGMGRILNIRIMGASTRAQVQFQTAGTKTLILQYARLEKVDVDF